MSGSYYALLIEKNARSSEEAVMVALRQSGILNICYAYKSRVKSELSLLEKKERKNKIRPDYDITDITDVLGIRLVTLFRDDVEDVFKGLIRIILHEGIVNPNPFLINYVDDIVIYVSNPYDELTVKVENIIKENGLSLTVKRMMNHESFLSLHIVTRLSRKINIANKDYHIPVEIQIRTVFEDVWGEIDHKYGYSIRSGKDSGVAIAHPEVILKHLKLFKKLTDTCAEYADTIHSDANPVEQIHVENIDSPSISEDTLAVLISLDIQTDQLKKYKEATRLKLEAQKEKDSGLVAFVNRFIQAAIAFRELAETQTSPITPHSTQYYIYYYSKMEEASCLFATNQKDKAQAALAIYQKLDNSYHGIPLLKLRLAQAYSKLGFNELAIEHYKQASNSLIEFDNAGANYSASTTKADHNYMRQYLPKLYGFELWIKFKSIPGDDSKSITTKINLVKNAYLITEIALPYCNENSALIIHNNLLSYAIDYVTIVKDNEACANDFCPDMKSHLNHILNHIEIETCEDLELLDTLARAFDYDKDIIKAEQAVDRIMSLVLEPTKNLFFDRNIMLEIAQDAYEMKQKYQYLNVEAE